jgi:diguanylate cyclase (GGDEF)-like protein/PAS domain S-box-containing protein
MKSLDKEEMQRLEELKSYCILDTASDRDFDNITKLIANICDTPFATITLIDENREWFKSTHGLEHTENDRSIAFCAKTIQSKSIYIVEDTLLDASYKNNPMVVNPPYIRFYAGVPLISPKGHALGALAVKDIKPRSLTALQVESLKTLADQVMVQFEIRRQSQELEALLKQRDKINYQLVAQTDRIEKEQEFLQALLENLSEGIVACDHKGNLSLFNDATRQLHGLDKTTIPPEKWADYYDLFLSDGKTRMSPDQIPLIRAFSGDKIVDEELVIAPKTLPTKIVKCSGQPIINSLGKKLGAVVAMRDITEQKNKESALKKSEAKLSAIFNQSYLFQGILDIDGTVLEVNDLAVNACGYVREDVIGKKFWDTGWWNKDASISSDIHDYVLSGQRGEIIQATTDYFVASGEVRQSDFILTPIKNENDEIAYLLVSGLDVTARKKAEIELSTLNRALRLLSSANELLIRSKSEEKLLADISELIVKVGGYSMAWVGYAYNDKEKSIKPIAHFGNFSHILNIKLSWSEDLEIGQGPAAKTIRGGVPIIIEDILTDRSFQPWAKSAVANGFRSAICLPLIHESTVFGLVVMYGSQSSKVSENEIRLLQELADDLAFGIMNARAQEERQRFQNALINIATSASALVDKDFFHQLAKSMAEATNAQVGLVAKIADDGTNRLKIVGFSDNDLGGESISFDLEIDEYKHLFEKDCFSLSPKDLAVVSNMPAIYSVGIQNGVGHKLFSTNGKVIGFMMVLFNNSHQEFNFTCSLLKIFAARAVSELDRQSADRFIREQASLLNKAQDAIMVRDLDNRVKFWNKGAERLYGWTSEEAVGQSIVNLIYNDNLHFDDAMKKLLVDGEWSGEIEQHSKSHEKLIIESHWTLVFDDNNKPTSVFTINTNITARKLADEKIQLLAFYDPLTSLPNRTLLIDRLKQALNNCERSQKFGALIFIDLDNFKSLNDTLGHDKGDLLLIEIGSRIKKCLRDYDSVARFGGDEFVVMLDNLSISETESALISSKVAEKLLSSLSQPYYLNEYEYQSSASIGVTLFSCNDTNENELLKRADLAMYQAKSSGKNSFRFYDPKMQSEISSRVLLESDLWQSINKHQFFLLYQPQINDLGRVIGAEALIRWNHPERGLVSPALFIPLAEETRLILPIGHWVLESACAQLVAWSMSKETSELSLSVNVSQCQFRQVDFVEQVFGVLDHFGANPKRLKIELTESLFAENIDDVIAKMQKLKARGIKLSLDDFGTGYSSLAYLKKMPIDQLKIDQSFVRDILINPNDASIANSIILMAKSLGIEVIAEGVETIEQKKYLFENGCTFYQGYLFSKPLSIYEFQAFVKK